MPLFQQQETLSFLHLTAGKCSRSICTKKLCQFEHEPESDVEVTDKSVDGDTSKLIMKIIIRKWF